MNRKMNTLLCICSVLAVIAVVRPAFDNAQAVEAASPAQSSTLSSSQRLSQDKFTAGEWKDARVGEPYPAGSHTWDRKTLRVTGAGAGLNIKGNDQFQFVRLTREAGDFEVVARLVDFTGEGDAAAGIMARMDNTPNSVMTTVFFKAKQNTAGWISRIPGTPPQGKPQVFSGGIPLAQDRCHFGSKSFAWARTSPSTNPATAISGP